ncbi:MAG: AI-2E family transporter [Bacteroidetes bacterium]|nr:AI-2E family transporter [Bacteroidota bacterium]
MLSDLDRFQRRFLFGLVVAITILFLWMVRSFLITLFLAAIFSALVNPVHRYLCSKLKLKPGYIAILTLLIFIFIVAIPVFGFFGLVAAQALDVSQSARPWIESQIIDAISWNELMSTYPFLGRFLPEQAELLAKLSEVTRSTGQFLANSVVGFTRGTAAFTLQLFVLVYSMFFFIRDGSAILDKILYYIPLPPESEQELIQKIVSVVKAVLKGSLVIAVIQGALAGLAFWIVGIPGWAFWTTVMMVLSIIPAIGSPLIWIPAAIVLFIQGPFWVALLFTLWCALVVGTIDNFMRPWLVGRDTKMSDLMVLLSTLGGIFLFGGIGFILGPIIASLFIAVWYMYGDAFAESLGQRPDSMSSDS